MTTTRNFIAHKWMFLLAYPLMALLAVHIGNENSFGQLIQIPSYYTDLILALCCSFALGLYIHRLVKCMDQKISWADEFQKRLFYQLMFGVIVPTVLLLGIEAIYLSFLNIKLRDSSIFYLELPVIFMLCLIVNLIHIVRYRNFPAHGFQKSGASENKKEVYKHHFMVQVGKGFLTVPIDEVAYFKIQHKLTFLIGQNGESYLYDFPFKEIIEKLPPGSFFQLNRQIIANRRSIVKSIHTKTRRLQIELSPAIGEQVFVAKTKAPGFLAWLQSE